jgi:4-amino-4-deoxy-L-arabinose transferase-like glycosyltransferase
MSRSPLALAASRELPHQRDASLWHKPLTWLLVLIALAISLDSMWQRKLANPDEGRYSVIAREMAASGDFVTPRLNDLAYFYKPPLQYWASAISINTFGESEFSARLYTKLAGLGCIAFMAFVGTRLYRAEVGILTAMVMAASPYFSAMTEVVTLDMGLTFWMTLGVGAFLVSQSERTVSAQQKYWLWLAWAGMAGAVLSKGLIGFVFPTAAIFLYGVATRNFRFWLNLQWLAGLTIFFAITAPWFILVSLQNPEFAQFFFIHEHVDRFLTDTHRRTEPWHFFIPILLLGSLPWLVSLFPACWQAMKRHASKGNEDQQKPFQPLLFVMLFCTFIFLFFSKSSSKLPAYILVFFPVLALVIAHYLHNATARALAWQVLPILFLAIAGALAAAQAPARRARDEMALSLYQAMSEWMVGAAVVLAIGALVGVVLLIKNRKWPALIVITFASLICIAAIERGYEKLSPMQSGYALAEAIKPHLSRDSRVYAVKTYDQSLPFYLSRPVTLVDYIDEFELGIKREPHKTIASLDDFAHAWNSPGNAVAIINPADVDKMHSLGISFQIIHTSPRRMALLKTKTTP